MRKQPAPEDAESRNTLLLYMQIHARPPTYIHTHKHKVPTERARLVSGRSTLLWSKERKKHGWVSGKRLLMWAGLLLLNALRQGSLSSGVYSGFSGSFTPGAPVSFGADCTRKSAWS